VTFIVEGSQVHRAYLRDTCLSMRQACVPTTTLISGETGEYSSAVQPAISGNGRFLTFVSTETSSSNAKLAQTGRLLLRDTCQGAEVPHCVATTFLVADTSQDDGPNEVRQGALVSNSGRYVAFISRASNLVLDDRNQFADAFVADTCIGSSACIPATWRISRGKGGLEADADSTDLAISRDGSVIAFTTAASTLTPDETNGVTDVFVYVRPSQH
jgi:WD40 repeat protein